MPIAASTATPLMIAAKWISQRRMPETTSAAIRVTPWMTITSTRAQSVSGAAISKPIVVMISSSSQP